MTFDLTLILIMVGLALAYLFLGARWRSWALLIMSALAIYLLQPRLNIRFLDFALPTATLFLSILSWYLTQEVGAIKGSLKKQDNALALILLIGIVLGLSLFRFVEVGQRPLPSRPPEPLHVALILGGLLLLGAFLGLGVKRGQQRLILWGMIALIVGLFIVLKTESLATPLAAWLRDATGKDSSLASPFDLGWLGFSYVAFRLIHTYRDRQSGILPALDLRTYVSYVIFTPAFLAGPIDRAERFAADYEALPQLQNWDASRLYPAAERIMLGLFKKFVIADTLAQGMSLTPDLAAQTEQAPAMWLLLYAYALRLYFDFSGYSDIAIGLGLLFGIRLPENFKAPYLKTNITAFWQSWHMSLSNWVRFYVFSPLSRYLLSRKKRPSSTFIVFITQCTTMIVIGLWHGISLNFFIWGVWHGVGLFVHKQFSDRSRKWHRELKKKPVQYRVWQVAVWALTFHFVVLAWVFFALPETAEAVRVLGVLFGLGGR